MSEEEEFFEEDFNDDEMIIDGGDDDDDDIILSDSFEEPTLRVEEQQPSKDEIIQEALVKRFNPKSGTALRLLSDLKEIMKSNPKDLGFSTNPIGNDLFNWEVQLFGFEKGTPMYDDLIKYEKMTKRNYVQLQVTFPPDYPNIPPFVRVVQPRFMFHTGRVTIGGSLCTDILTLESWNPMYDIQGLMVNVTAEILNGKPRIDFSNNSPYSLEEAKQAYLRVAHDHGWKTSQWLPKK
ncbi:Ubiquitin-conjugating enzyme family protein [Tritrichomonas foetus]|uniref:Ubiquitin-conjugating enzyme family protein n=1 Tax=Tritrichomonas foetus TaxID=1144522 RepID=A0A1J4JLL6_9EUKA|nr:Ubiquitin-conjugating enzyme family protein [Tritrichomonas foetus]|eukprot:OHS98164.1 Ubiquitin-conjugating enzyme family protein [Tritrichomonas foetus]